MDFEEQEDEEMGMGPTASYDSLGNPNRVKATSGGGEIMVVHHHHQANNNNNINNNNNNNKAKYRECLKNHAVGIGGHALDGCGEFLPAGADGTIDALKCAACNCHRNFHRKETHPTSAVGPYLLTSHRHHQPLPPPPRHHHQFSAYYPAGYLHVGGGPTALALPSTSGAHNNNNIGGEDHEEEGVSGGDGGVTRKRFRTKFTQEQKEGMLGLAERLGWRIQKHDEGVVQQFCDKMGVTRHVLKVWMHNNKHTLGKKP